MDSLLKTALVYDPFNLHHTLDGHPENYRRLEGTWALLEDDGILQRLERVESKAAPRNALLRVHTQEHVNRVQAMAERGGGRLDADTYVNVDSYQAALLAAGGVIAVVDAVMQGQVKNGFALVRPPGHHATIDRAMGFCLFGNVAIAARWAQDHYGIQRVMIIDFDVHHGNGTETIFYNDPSVLFYSIHQYPHYPGSGTIDERGAAAGIGTTINVPAPPRAGDAGYLHAFRQIAEPAARRFKPELILLSAGFDGHWMDPLADINLSISGYVEQVRAVMALADELCHGRLICALEGGYHLEVLAHSILSTLRMLSESKEGISDPFGPSPVEERDINALVAEVRRLHKL